jgi:prepilin-type N-terminal cleavage/methylation domain-containing protein
MAARDETRRRRRGGFTLLELVVALAVLAMIAASVTVGIRLASASIARGEAVAHDAARIRATVAILERAIRSADPLPIPVEDNTTFYFVGDAKIVRFLTAQPPATIGGNGPVLISFFELSGDDGGLAVATASPFRPEGAGKWSGTDDPRVLVPGATGISFTYSQGPAEDGTWEWQPAWDPKETGRLPAAVRVEFTVETPEGPVRTAFVVPIPVGGGVGG